MQKFKKIIKKISPLLQVLSFVVALVMIYSLKIDTDNLRIAQSTYFNSLRPTWNSQLTFAENNLDLISVEFNPVNEGILLQNLEITFPEGYIRTNPIKTYNNVWK